MSSTQTTRSGGGGRNQGKKAGGGGDTTTATMNNNQHKKQQPLDGSGLKQQNVENNKENSIPKSSHAKPTLEQIRIAQIVEIGNGSDDPKMPEKVASLMETTQRSEEDVCYALYECDNDMDRAVIYLLEQLPEGAFEISSKKKKNRLQSATNNGTNDGDDWIETGGGGVGSAHKNDFRDRSRSRGGGSGIRGGRGGDSRGYRGGRDSDKTGGGGGGGAGGESTWRGGRSGGAGGPSGGGPGRGRGGGFGSRGGRGGGRNGPRSMGSRDQGGGRGYTRREDAGGLDSVDNWDNSQAATVVTTTEIKTDDSWGDWDNEEYTGSLADTKVFTPSATAPVSGGATVASVVSSGQDVHVPSVPPGLGGDDEMVPPQQQYSTVASGGAATGNSVSSGTVTVSATSQQFPDLAHHHLRQSLDIPSQLSSATLSAEQSQYFNSLSSQNSSQQSNSYQAAPVQYPPSSYGTNHSTAYGDPAGAQQPVARKPRAKVPPPSKIPASAVEMPGDNIGYLDVQFGLDFGSEDTFDALSDKFNAVSIESNSQVVVVGGGQDQDQYQSSKSQQQTISTSGLSGSQLSDNLGSSYRGANSGVVSQSVTNNNSVGVNSAPAGYGSSYSKRTSYSQSGGQVQANNYSSNAGYGVSSGGQQSGQTGSGGYSQSSQQSSNAFGSYNQNTGYPSHQGSTGVSQNSGQVNNVSQVSQSVSSVVNQQAGPGSQGVVNSSSGSTNVGSVAAGGGGYYANPVAMSAYQPAQTTGYDAGQSDNVYGNSSGYASCSTAVVSGSNSSGGTSAVNSSANSVAAQFGAFAASKQLSKDNSTPISSTAYDSVNSNVSSGTGGSGSVAGNNAPNAISNNAAVTAASTNNSPSSLGLANNTKVSSNAATTKSSGMVSTNIPIVSQYIQAGVPFYQPPMYSYEEIQMLQQRLPHMQTGYYDMNYQTPTSLGAAGREANIGSVAAYSTMSDGRFTRTDNSSPVSNVPSTMSQQTGSGGPMLNLPYAYFYSGNMMPGGFQYGAPVYPQQMATANATSGGQFPKPSYNSGYGSSAYESLNQSAQDYSKSGYQSASVGQQQSKGQSVNNPQQSGSGSDITSSMYGKSHVALNKVNSYDKQSFHSGTPPPFNLAGTQTTGQTSAQAYGMYISPMPAPHHNMNMHQPMHQDSQRPQSSSQGKSGAKQGGGGYSPSYWTAQN